MSYLLKLSAAIALYGVCVTVGLYSVAFRLENAWMTETELFLALGWLPWAVLPAAVAASLLLRAAVEEYEGE